MPAAVASRQGTRDVITIKGSTAIVTEFFGYAVNSILYQRGIYPEENFTRVKKYGLPMLICKDDRVVDYIQQVMSQLSGNAPDHSSTECAILLGDFSKQCKAGNEVIAGTQWLTSGQLQRLVMVVASVSNREVLERWMFNIETDKEVISGGAVRHKPDKVIAGEIQAILRQITASVTFLPLLDEACTFDLLAYTAADSSVPAAWEESDARLITNSQDVKLRSFSTKVHHVDAMVAFKRDDEEDF